MGKILAVPTCACKFRSQYPQSKLDILVHTRKPSTEVGERCYGPAQGGHSDRRESGRRHRRDQDTAKKNDTQTLSILRHAVAIYLLQCRIIYFLQSKNLAKAYIIKS